MSSTRIPFTVEAVDPWSGARATRFSTMHGVVETPVFMPVATQAALRGVDTTTVRALDYPVLLANTYHLLLRPGADVFRHFGGIHDFMRWPGVVLTDSGGFQIFSLDQHRTISEEGARFRSYTDGAFHMLTPELSIGMQQAIGSDIMMVLDQCIDATSDEPTTRAALELTARWAERSLAARGESRQALFGVVQGGSFTHLRKVSAGQICSLPFDGFALGGLAVGETKDVREEVIAYSAALLPSTKPRYLMGVGTPIDLLEAVRRGMDMFDCILPTSLAHQGVCFTSRGKVELRRRVHQRSREPLDPNCPCETCARFSRGYLHHLVRANEFIVHNYLSIHNLTFYRALMRDMRQSILAGSFQSLYESREALLRSEDIDNPPKPAPRALRAAPMVLGDYEVTVHPNGYGSIRQQSSGETMHSVSEPSAEARALYVDQTNLLSRVKTPGPPLVIWDVGLGAATNVMAFLAALKEIPHFERPVLIGSFERDLDPLRLALRYPHFFTHLRSGAPHRLLKEGVWESSERPLSWRLFEGDFLVRKSDAPTPDVIWYDPFSFKVDAPLWSMGTFLTLLDRCRDNDTTLFTYTASTAVRAALLAAGWYVGVGVGTGPKTETTVALTPLAADRQRDVSLLGAAWLARWNRSDSRQPFGTEGVEFQERVAAHPQFRR